MSSIAGIRKDYMQKKFDEADTAASAIAQFGLWWDEAVKSEIDEVNAMTLATASKEGVPDARIVLLKGYDEKGFVFFRHGIGCRFYVLCSMFCFCVLLLLLRSEH